jgi:hypothetical protein
MEYSDEGVVAVRGTKCDMLSDSEDRPGDKNSSISCIVLDVSRCWSCVESFNSPGLS